jgi:hypothetical protein
MFFSRVNTCFAMNADPILFLTVVVGAAPPPHVPNEYLESCIFHNPNACSLYPVQPVLRWHACCLCIVLHRPTNRIFCVCVNFLTYTPVYIPVRFVQSIPPFYGTCRVLQEDPSDALRVTRNKILAVWPTVERSSRLSCQNLRHLVLGLTASCTLLQFQNGKNATQQVHNSLE